MKKLLTIFLSVALVLPLYSQENDLGDYDYDYEDYDYEDYDDNSSDYNDYSYNDESEDTAAAGEKTAPQEAAPKADPKAPAPQLTHETHEEKPKKKSAPKPQEEKEYFFTRKHFEMGIDAGIGVDNGLVGLNDILRKKIMIDVSKIAQSVPEDGSGLNFGFSADFFMNVKNIHIIKGLWDFGFIAGVEGSVNLNFPKSLFTLISEGNTKQHDSSGKISASGAIFSEVGLKGSAKYRIGGKKLYIGVKPSIFTPLVYIPSSTGISYQISTKKEEIENGVKTIKDGLFLTTEGEISVYTPTPFNHLEPIRFIYGANGFDLSLEGEYALFPFLDIGASVANIPISPATLTTAMKMTLKPFSPGLKGEEILDGKTPKNPDFEFDKPNYYNVEFKVHRPLRFDFYGRYKLFHSEFLVFRPNIGCSVNINEYDENLYINCGLEASLNLLNLFIFYAGSGYKETIWRQRAGFALNLRAFELDLEATLRDNTFMGCFKKQGFELNVGIRFGW